MSRLPVNLPLNKDALVEFALRQVDNLGYELQSRGISGQVNRHNLAALAMTKQQQLKGEITRYELRLGMQRAKLEKLRHQAVDTLDQLIDQLPEPIAQQINRAKHYVA